MAIYHYAIIHHDRINDPCSVSRMKYDPFLLTVY